MEYPYVAEQVVLKNKENLEQEEYQYNVFGNGFEFLAADRISPQTTYSIIDQSNTLGVHGENAINFLDLIYILIEYQKRMRLVYDTKKKAGIWLAMHIGL